MREKHKLRMFEKVFGPKRDEVTGKKKRLHNKELHHSYSSPNIQLIKSTRMRWVGIYEGHKMCIQGLAGET
jgi:hypothetical protein